MMRERQMTRDHDDKAARARHRAAKLERQRAWPMVVAYTCAAIGVLCYLVAVSADDILLSMLLVGLGSIWFGTALIVSVLVALKAVSS